MTCPCYPSGNLRPQLTFLGASASPVLHVSRHVSSALHVFLQTMDVGACSCVFLARRPHLQGTAGERRTPPEGFWSKPRWPASQVRQARGHVWCDSAELAVHPRQKQGSRVALCMKPPSNETFSMTTECLHVAHQVGPSATAHS